MDEACRAAWAEYQATWRRRKMIGYYDRQGRPMSEDDFCQGLGDREYKVVRQTTIGEDEAFVSTVWLGLDHGWGGDEPLIFETMVFAEGLDIHEEQQRYPTEGQAVVGHCFLLASTLRELGVPTAEAAFEVARFATEHDAGHIIVSTKTGQLVDWQPRGEPPT